MYGEVNLDFTPKNLGSPSTHHRAAAASIAILERLRADKFRHQNHRFEWTRGGFHICANRIVACFNYSIYFLPVGSDD